MNTFYSHLGILISLSILGLSLIGWLLYFVHLRTHSQEVGISDDQVVRLLVHLLIFATFNMALFTLVLLGK